MIVCSCNVLSDKDVRSCLQLGPDCPRTPAQIYRCLGCTPNCGRCAQTLRTIINDVMGPEAEGCRDSSGEECASAPIFLMQAAE